MVLGSGNVVHNLGQLQFDANAAPPGWAVQFNAAVRAAVLAGEHPRLIDYTHLDSGAMLSVPTPEHYLPLLYVLALAQPAEAVHIPFEGLELGSISMLSVLVGG